jgi:glycosyltransferase involved in cell wall biosynthesis
MQQAEASGGAAPSGRLAILVKRFPRLSETFVLHEVRELRRQGVDLELFALLDPHEDIVHEDARALMSEVSYLRPSDDRRGLLAALREGAPTLLRHPRGALRALAFAARRRRATRRHLIEALVLVRRMEARGLTHVHAHFAHSPSSVAELASMISGIPFSFTAHAKDLYTTLDVNVARRAQNASFVVTCTESNRRYLASVAGLRVDEIVLARHGVDLDRFASARRDPVPGRVLSIGRLIPKKGYFVLADALAILRSRGVPFEWRIVGGGPLRAELIEYVDAAAIGADVHLVGACTQDEVVRECAAAEVFALTPVVTEDGDRDGIPNVLREAMAAGVAVVTTDVSGIPELISGGETGWLAPAGEVEAVADALEEALTNARRRADVAAAGRAFVLEHCGLAESVTGLVALFGSHGVRVHEPAGLR